VVSSKAEDQIDQSGPRDRADRRVRADVDPEDLLGAVASLGMSAHNDGPGRAERMVALLVDGLRYGTSRR
jgi:hypothetical protein